MIMTSVDLMSAVTVSPTEMPISSTLCRVMTLSMRVPPAISTVTLAVMVPRAISRMVPVSWLRAEIFGVGCGAGHVNGDLGCSWRP